MNTWGSLARVYEHEGTVVGIYALKGGPCTQAICVQEVQMSSPSGTYSYAFNDSRVISEQIEGRSS